MQLHYKTCMIGPQWTIINNMRINYAKTKEMILGPLAKCPPDLLSHSSTDAACIERVKCFKLLEIYLSDD